MTQIIVTGENSRVVDLDSQGEALLREQRQRFIDKFGRVPEGDDPVFFDPDCDVPTPLTAERLVELTGVDIETMNRVADDRRAVLEEHGLSRKIGRNDLCPCGSGLKFKRCHDAR